MRRHHHTQIIVLLAYGAMLAGCGGRAYVFDTDNDSGLRSHAESQSDGSVTVTASVPGREESDSIFGVSLYDQGIQPVWIEIENAGSSQIRYAPVSTDRYYFSPFEVAYKNRSGYSDEARLEMERRFDELGMPRYIDPGETRSGFIFTHLDEGAKGFNVDLFGTAESYFFTFLLRVPGFVPDYANLDFDSIYSDEEITVVQDDDLYEALRNLPCCSTDENAVTADVPINIILLGPGQELLRALLRSNWTETSVSESVEKKSHYLFGRSQDAIFRYKNVADDNFYELRAWLAPLLSGENRIWAAQVTHYYSRGPIFFQFDPDVDNARNFAMQNLLYGQSLERMGWISGKEVVPIESYWQRLVNRPYFTDGFRLVMWLSGDPVSMMDIQTLDWDREEGTRR